MPGAGILSTEVIIMLQSECWFEFLNLPGLTTTYCFHAKCKLDLYVISQATSTSNIEAPFINWNVMTYGAVLPLKVLFMSLSVGV